jgi:hypothetical protein
MLFICDQKRSIPAARYVKETTFLRYIFPFRLSWYKTAGFKGLILLIYSCPEQYEHIFRFPPGAGAGLWRDVVRL